MCLVLALVVLGTPGALAAQEWSEWRMLGRLQNAVGTLMILEWQWRRSAVTADHSSARWRVINRTGDVMWNVSIADKVYGCKNGTRIERSGELAGDGLYNAIRAGGSSTTLPDNLGDCDEVEWVSMTLAEAVRYARERGGDKRPWRDYGTVTTY